MASCLTLTLDHMLSTECDCRNLLITLIVRGVDSTCGMTPKVEQEAGQRYFCSLRKMFFLSRDSEVSLWGSTLSIKCNKNILKH